MSVQIWPPIAPDDLRKEEEASLARELEWLLSSLQETLTSLKSGLEECIALLAPREPGSTLVLSSLRSESLKGFVTRVGTRIVKGVRLFSSSVKNPRNVAVLPANGKPQPHPDIHLRLPSLPPPRGSSSYKLVLSGSPAAPPLNIPQLTKVRNLINESLDVVDVSLWTGDAKDASFISGQLQLLFDNIQGARQALKGTDVQDWWEGPPLDERVFDPSLPPTISFHLSICEAALQLCIRTLSPTAPASTATSSSETSSFTGFNFRDRLSTAITGNKRPTHDEVDQIFVYRGQEVRVREKIRVESQDPSLMAMMAKLSALEHNVALSRKALDIVMGRDE
ncbi:MAG: hypothetical protein M1827_007307 [Pycnora praestabilis]|nr:MAG: hypothetical protein M1827_007307 [Pycnora praestabilis]